MQVAVTLFPGVSADECEAFTLVFDHVAGVELVGVGERTGTIEGPGGGQHADATFDEVTHPDVVLVPGGLGCAAAARDERLLDWLRLVAPRCEWLAASSTGTVIVAAAGLLHDQEAATHWLASDLLAEYGSATASERIVQIGRVITCEGRITALHVALLVTLRIAGPEAVAHARAALAAGPRPDAARPGRLRQWWDRVSERRTTTGPGRPRNRELEAPDDIEFDVLRPR